jgi:hypothetical protein
MLCILPWEKEEEETVVIEFLPFAVVVVFFSIKTSFRICINFWERQVEMIWYLNITTIHNAMQGDQNQTDQK